jgi:hypothetical protein
LAISTASPAAAVEIDQVADGFAGPLGLAIGADGTVYVAQVFLGTLTAIDRDGDRTDLVTGNPWPEAWKPWAASRSSTPPGWVSPADRRAKRT